MESHLSSEIKQKCSLFQTDNQLGSSTLIAKIVFGFLGFEISSTVFTPLTEFHKISRNRSRFASNAVWRTIVSHSSWLFSINSVFMAGFASTEGENVGGNEDTSRRVRIN